MFYFTCNESKIYESFTFWNKLQEKNELFHDILIYWDAPVMLNFSRSDQMKKQTHLHLEWCKGEFFFSFLGELFLNSRTEPS